MSNANPNRKKDNLHSFYTRTEIGAIFASIIGNISPRKIIDLGAGEGTLSKAAFKEWPSAKYVTIDIDPSVKNDLTTHFLERRANHSHYELDVLKTDLPKAIRKEGLFDLALCNPPFYKLPLNDNSVSILKQSKIIENINSPSDNSAELLFLGQNLRLLKRGGTLALIVPDGFVTGRRLKNIRHNILCNHTVDTVLQLQNHSFHKTEARCFVIILRKNTGPTSLIKLIKQYPNGSLSDAIEISAIHAKTRMDYDYHSNFCTSEHQHIQLRKLGADIKRGSFSTAERKNSNFPIFHTTDFKSLDENKILIGGSEIPYNEKTVLAKQGDIIMARVDRSLHQKVALVVSGVTPITDCVYRIRLPTDFQKVVFSALTSEKGKTALLHATKGVGARLIGKEDLLELNIPI